MQERFKAFEPEAIHIATEGPIGLAARRICVEWKLPFTTSYHTRFPEYVSARLPLPLAAGYAYMRWFHKPSGPADGGDADHARRAGRARLPQHLALVARRRHRRSSTRAATGEPDLFAGLRPADLALCRPRRGGEEHRGLPGLDLPGTKVVVGDGPQREELAAQVSGGGVPPAPRSATDLAAHFACADVFVFPSLTDTFGLVILEAMAAGTPVAAFRRPGPIDIIPNSGAGVLAETCDRGPARGLPGRA